MTFNDNIFAGNPDRRSDSSSEAYSDDELYKDDGAEDRIEAEYYSASESSSGVQEREKTFTDASSGQDEVYVADAYSDGEDTLSQDDVQGSYADQSLYSDVDFNNSQEYEGQNRSYGEEWDATSQDDASHDFDNLGMPSIVNPVDSENAGTSDSDDAPWGATMTVGSTVYATTIFWQPLQDPDNPLPEVRETAENVLENADLYVIRPTGMPQYGLGISSEGHKPGMPVAALALADAFSDQASSVSVFKVPEGWWFVAIRNDLILSEDDMLYQKEEDAKRTFLSMMAVPDWGRKIAPSEWGIEDTEEVDIAELFAKAPKIKLAKLKNDFNIKTIIILAVAIILVAWGGFALLSHFSGSEDVIEEVVAPPPVVKPVVEKPKVMSVPMPWESIVLPSDFINVCTNSVSQLTAARIPGWTLGNVDCQQVGLTTSWNMVQGRLGNLQTALKMYNIEGLNFTISDNGRSAIGSINFGSLRKTYSAPTLRTQEIVTELTDIFQALNIPLSVSVSNISPAASDRAIQQEPYSFVNFSFSSNLPVSEWRIFFSNFDALELTSMVYNVNSNNWKYEGRIYGKK